MKPRLLKIGGKWFCGEPMNPWRNCFMIGRYGATPKEAFYAWIESSSTEQTFAKSIKRYFRYLLTMK